MKLTLITGVLFLSIALFWAPALSSALDQKESQNGLVVMPALKTPLCGQDGDKDARYYPDGVLWIAVECKEGKEDGSFNVYYPWGETREEGKYTEGKREGEFKVYTTKGELYKQTTYKDGRQHGEEITYYPDEKVARVMPYLNGKREGILKSYYKNGVTALKANYKNGRQIGKIERFDETGAQMKSKTFEGTYNNIDQAAAEGFNAWADLGHSHDSETELGIQNGTKYRKRLSKASGGSVIFW